MPTPPPPSPRPLASHLRPSDLRAVSRLAVDATLGVTGIVEQLHHTILKRTHPLGVVPPGGTRGITGLVYRSVRGVTRMVGGGLDIALQPVQSWLEGRGSTAPPPSNERASVVAALNGVLGDHLEASGNPLATPMVLLHGDQPLQVQRDALAAALPQASPRLLLVLHGLCMQPGQLREGLDLGAQVGAACGSTVLYLRYNTGRHVVANGRELADLMEKLAAAWPVPLQRVDMLAHSMGGLVARSACLQAQASQHEWLALLRSLVFLGTPHHGAPLERGGHGIDLLLGASPYTAAFSRLTGLRSAGIRDLREGHVSMGNGAPVAVPLPAGVACYAVAGTLGAAPRLGDRVLGDGLVTVESALGRHPDPGRVLAFAPDHVWVGTGLGHLELLHSPAVLEQVLRWLAPPAAAAG